MKNRAINLSLFILLILIIYYHRELFLLQKSLNISIMKKIASYLKNQRMVYYLVFVFLYGMVHSLSPGHGKAYIFNLSLRYNFSKLLFFSGLIAYGQGIVSYLIALFIIKSLSQLQSIDILAKNIYGITLVALSLMNLISECRDKHADNSKFVIGVFFPCSGILSVLLLSKLLNKDIPFIYLVFIMSSGVFTSLSIFSFIITKLNLSFNVNKKCNQLFNFVISIIILIIGIYMLFLR